jgi:hypothetical protein
MPTKTRLPTNAINGLEDSLAILHDIWPNLTAACERAEHRYQDAALLADLNRLVRGVSVIEHHLRNARRNEYEERSAGDDR